MFGSSSRGDTGAGLQDWSTLQYTNDWNDGFSSLWRTGYRYNNTYLDPSTVSSKGISLAVEPADTRERITYGAGLLTRRSDILYGSLRASMVGPPNYFGSSILQMAVQFNNSEYIKTSLFSNGLQPNESTLQWTYSASQANSKPYIQLLDQVLDPQSFNEHRIDWMGPEELHFATDAGTSSNSSVVHNLSLSKKSVRNLPTQGGPVSFTHFSSGDSSQGQSPPLYHQPTAGIKYIRLFYNSSIVERAHQFEEQCTLSPEETCSTEDFTLRGSTPFFSASLDRQKIAKAKYQTPLYSVICCSISGGLFFILLAHALCIRWLKANEKQKAFVRQESSKYLPDTIDKADDSLYADEPELSALGKISQDVRRWEDPNWLAAARGLDWDDGDSSEDDESDIEDDIEDPLRVNRRPMSLSSFGYGSFQVHTEGQNSHDQAILSLDHGNQNRNTHDSTNPSLMIGQERGIRQDIEQDENPGRISQAVEVLADEPDSRSNYAHSSSSHTCSKASNASKNCAVLDNESVQTLSRSYSATSTGKELNSNPSLKIHWRAPGAEWQVSSEPVTSQTGGRLAQRKDSLAIEGNRPVTPSEAVNNVQLWFSKQVKKLFVGEESGGKTASGAARVEYLDGLRGFACFLVSFHHFMLIFYYGVTTAGSPMHYPNLENWLRRLFGAILVNGGLNVGIFFCLAARVIANRYLVRGRLQDLAEAIHRRVPRLMLPITGGILISYFLIEADAFHWVERLNSRTWSPWSYYQDYENLGVFINDYLSLWFTIPPAVPPMITTYATGILWTVPVIVQSSWTVFLCALIAREMPNAKKRYTFYSICWICSWYADRFDYFFISGLVIADLDNRIKYRERAAKGIPLIPDLLRTKVPTKVANLRIHGQIFAWVIFLSGAVVSWLDQINGPGKDIMLKEHGIHPDFANARPHSWSPNRNSLEYVDPRLFDFFFVIGFFLLCDLCSTFRAFFQLRFWSAFGRNAFSLYLLHGVVFWSWGAWLCLKMLASGIPYWASILVVFITSYLWLAIICEMFTRTFDAWGVSISKSFWRATTGGLGRRL